MQYLALSPTIEESCRQGVASPSDCAQTTSNPNQISGMSVAGYVLLVVLVIGVVVGIVKKAKP